MTNNKNAIDMKTISLKQFENFRWLFTIGLGILVTSCGTYQNSSYYDNDGVYGSSDNTQNRVVQNDNANSEYYKNYFSNINQENEEIFTNVDNYTTPVDTTATAKQNTTNGYNGWGQNSTNVTVNYFDAYGAGWNGWYGSGWGWNNGWGWNSWYGPGWGWNNGWGWNSWYGPGWGWNTGWGWNSWYGAGWGWGGWYSPYYGYGYGYPYYGNYGWASNYGYNGGRRNTIYRNNLGGINGSRVANGYTRSNTVNPRNSDVRPTNLGVRPNNGGVRSTTVVNNGSPRTVTNPNSVGNVRNNSVQNVTPTRTESTPRSYTPTRSYSPSSSSYGGGSYGGGGGGFGGGGGGRSGGGGRR